MNSRSFGYDSVDRLTRADSAGGAYPREDYVHDKNGKRTVVERRVNIADTVPTESDSYTRTSGTNRIASVALAGGGTRSFTHDARGNLTAETRPGGPSITIGYDGYARLASYSIAGAETQAMLYNGIDERVGLTISLDGSTFAERRYIYDIGHRITGEYGATTADLRAEYIWFLPEVGDASAFGGGDGLGGYMPLAVAVPDAVGSKLQWVQGNHLGTSVVTTDATGTVIAPSGYDRIGFPGQTQQHADLYYNYYRDYDPTLGRYVQADPIGLDGNQNPYLYVGANPLSRIDPLGLEFLNVLPGNEAIAYSPFWEYARLPQAKRKEGLYIAAHGNPDIICVSENGVGKKCMGPDRFAIWLRARYDLSKFKYIELWSCRTGQESDGFAQILSNNLKIPVVAPTKYGWFTTTPGRSGFRSIQERGFWGGRHIRKDARQLGKPE